LLSESARMGSAAEARCRVPAPNSMPRAVTVIALDAAGEAVVRRLAGAGWPHSTFLTAASQGGPGGGLSDLAGHDRSLADEVGAADLIVFVAGPGGHAHAASIVGPICSLHRVTTTAFVVGVGSVAEQAPGSPLSATLAQLRPWSLMVVIASGDDYIDDMMTALRA
jgi:hypothetical protein